MAGGTQLQLRGEGFPASGRMECVFSDRLVTNATVVSQSLVQCAAPPSSTVNGQCPTQVCRAAPSRCWALPIPRGGSPNSPDGLFAHQEQEPIRGRPAVRGKSAYGGRPGQRVEEQGTWAAQKHSEAGYGRPVDGGAWAAKTAKRPRQQPAHPQYANYWAPLTHKRHIPPHPAQPRHTNHWAPRTRKRHQREHRPQRPTERSDPTQHAKGRTGDRPGPRKGATTRRNVTQGGGGAVPQPICGTKPPPPSPAVARHSKNRQKFVKEIVTYLCRIAMRIPSVF